MSRSRKKTKIFGVTNAQSEKLDKRFANRKLRRKVKIKVKARKDILPLLKEVSNIWGFAKDGKTYDSRANNRLLRK